MAAPSLVFGRSPLKLGVRLRPLGITVVSTIVDFVANNYEWFFSGLGVFLLGGLIAGVRYMARREQSENHPQIVLHTQNIDLRARDYHENYDHALGIFISNTGNSSVHIHRALFKDRVPMLWIFRRKGDLPIYAKAFKDAERDAYELKFGDQWYDPQTDIPGEERVMTYLPLSSAVPHDKPNRKKHGQVILRYSTQERAGTHRVYV